MPRPSGQSFWDRIADRYAARQIKDVTAYEAMLADVGSRLRPTDLVLEIGCGTGGTAIHLAPGVARYTATDYSAEMIRIASAKAAPGNLKFRQAHAETAFDGGPFDAVCAFNVLHLVDDLPRLLRDSHANLAPGGLLISKTWCFADLDLRFRLLFRALRLVGLFPPARFLSAPDLEHAIKAAGFGIVHSKVFGKRRQNPYIVARKALGPDPTEASATGVSLTASERPKV